METPEAPSQPELEVVESLPEKPVSDVDAEDVKGGATAEPRAPMQPIIERTF